jgi:hypothetical protein
MFDINDYYKKKSAIKKIASNEQTTLGNLVVTTSI